MLQFIGLRPSGAMHSWVTGLWTSYISRSHDITSICTSHYMATSSTAITGCTHQIPWQATQWVLYMITMCKTGTYCHTEYEFTPDQKCWHQHVFWAATEQLPHVHSKRQGRVLFGHSVNIFLQKNIVASNHTKSHLYCCINLCKQNKRFISRMKRIWAIAHIYTIV